MNKKSIWIAGIAVVFTLGMVTISSAFSEVSGQSTQLPSAPNYSDTCAHGHNGFDCKAPQYRTDISELQAKAADLEKRVSQLESR